MFEGFPELVEASGDPRIQEAFEGLNDPSVEFLQEVRDRVMAIGDPTLDAALEQDYESGREELRALVRALLEARPF